MNEQSLHLITSSEGLKALVRNLTKRENNAMFPRYFAGQASRFRCIAIFKKKFF